MDARAAGDDAGGVSGEIEALRRSAMASSDDGRLEALSNLGHKLAWLCRIKYLDTMWWSPAGQRAEDAGRNRNASTSSDVDTGDEVGRYVPKTPAAEALLALLVFLDEERSLVAPKGRSKHQLVRSAVLPLLLYAGRAKGACEFLSVAENASGCHEGIDTFVRWELLACACIEAKLPGRAVRVTRSLLDEGFELPEAEERTSRHEGCGGDDDGGPTASRAPNREDDPLSSLFQPSDGARKVRPRGGSSRGLAFHGRPPPFSSLTDRPPSSRSATGGSPGAPAAAGLPGQARRAQDANEGARLQRRIWSGGGHRVGRKGPRPVQGRPKRPGTPARVLRHRLRRLHPRDSVSGPPGQPELLPSSRGA
mmetsp:Transcript_7077/g.24339  ORF Transcript_7077/g.24339 Transcript_7077/m.24339 type:complete len:365 (-) Transcript_7077:1011-2105(-)